MSAIGRPRPGEPRGARLGQRGVQQGNGILAAQRFMEAWRATVRSASNSHNSALVGSKRFQRMSKRARAAARSEAKFPVGLSSEGDSKGGSKEGSKGVR